jgi:protein ImuB
MYAVLLLPNFRLQAARRFRPAPVGNAFAVTCDDGSVFEINDAAARQGVRVGMPGVQALARSPQLTLLSRTRATEQVLQQALLEVADSLSPEIEATGEGCCTIDLRRADVGDWNRWCESILQRFVALELKARIGIAPNPDLAFLAARRAESFLVVPAPATFLAQLAITEIDPPPHLQALLRDWGIHTLGQFTSLPRGDLADRLGPEMDRLYQRASGQTERLLRLIRPTETYSENYEFEHEVETTEPLLFLLRRFLDQLTLRLSSAYRVVARMILDLPLDDGTQHQHIFAVPTPTGDVEVLFRILHTHLEDLRLTAHPKGVRLHVDPVRPDHQQLRFFESPLRDPNRFGETLARLSALVGAENVGVVELENSHRSDAFCLVEPRFHQFVEAVQEPEESMLIGLPLRRYRPPIPATVRVVKQQPVEVESISLRGRLLETLGPYRASGDWWDREQWSVEEWDVEIQGHGLYRLHREPAGWFIDGFYDAELR